MSQQLLLEATTQASRALEKDGIGYRVIGGQAVTMLGGGRVTEDVDVLVNCPGLDAREAIMKHNKDFAMHHPKLLYKSSVKVELLQGGAQAFLKMPLVSALPRIFVSDAQRPDNSSRGRNADSFVVAVADPSGLIWLKLRRWFQIAESTRPQSVTKARNDATDIIFLLRSLVQNGGSMQADDSSKARDAVQLFVKKYPNTKQDWQKAYPL